MYIMLDYGYTNIQKKESEVCPQLWLMESKQKVKRNARRHWHNWTNFYWASLTVIQSSCLIAALKFISISEYDFTNEFILLNFWKAYLTRIFALTLPWFHQTEGRPKDSSSYMLIYSSSNMIHYSLTDSPLLITLPHKPELYVCKWQQFGFFAFKEAILYKFVPITYLTLGGGL